MAEVAVGYSWAHLIGRRRSEKVVELTTEVGTVTLADICRGRSLDELDFFREVWTFLVQHGCVIEKPIPGSDESTDE